MRESGEGQGGDLGENLGNISGRESGNGLGRDLREGLGVSGERV